MRTTLHNCAIGGCPCQVPSHLLMCIDHWRLVPAPLQREVVAAWRQRSNYRRVRGLEALGDAQNYANVIDRAKTAVTEKLAARVAKQAEIYGDFFNQPSSTLRDELSKQEHGDTTKQGRKA